MRDRLLHAALAAVWCAAAPVHTSEAAAAGPPDLPRHELILARHSDAARTDYDVWRMCGDGSQLAALVVEEGHQFQLSVAPDGSEFLYTSRPPGGKGDIWRRGFGRGEPVNLTDHPANDVQPAWSPDGKRVAFFSDRDAEKPDLYLLELEDGSITRLTDNAFHDSGAAWSPDGGSILFTRYFPGSEEAAERREGAGEIFRLDLASGEEVQLTELGGYNGDVTYAPDGSWIAFHRAADGGVELWRIDADGSDPRPLTDTPIDEYTPRFSPDGGWIAFTAGSGHDGLGTFDLYLMRPDGSDRRLLNAAPNTEAWHEWRPGEHTCR